MLIVSRDALCCVLQRAGRTLHRPNRMPRSPRASLRPWPAVQYLPPSGKAWARPALGCMGREVEGRGRRKWRHAACILVPGTRPRHAHSSSERWLSPPGARLSRFPFLGRRALTRPAARWPYVNEQCLITPECMTAAAGAAGKAPSPARPAAVVATALAVKPRIRVRPDMRESRSRTREISTLIEPGEDLGRGDTA